MKSVFRDFWVGVCVIVASLAGGGVSAQFLSADIIAAERIDDAMRQEMLDLVSPAMKKLVSGEPEAVSDARGTLLNPLRDASATGVFKQAFSELIAPRIEAAATHENLLVRLNAMILLAQMTDEPSKALVIAGLEDESLAVQRKAMEALRSRVQQYLLMPANNDRARIGIESAVERISAMLDARPAPHPIVVTPAMMVFLDINTPESHARLVEHLNQRVAVHAANPGQRFDGELIAIERLARVVTGSRPFPKALAAALNRAALRYGRLAIAQLSTGKLETRDAAEAADMLGQCLQALGAVTAAAGINPPPGQAQVRTWLQEEDWQAIRTLIQDAWPPILSAEPFNLTEQDLAVQ